MTLSDLVPWTRKDRPLETADAPDWTGSSAISPFMRLHQEMNRMFEDAFRSLEIPGGGWSRQWPSLEVEETDHGYRVTAELPGLDENDVEVTMQDGVLSIRGEKQVESERKGRRVSERYYGRFERRIALDGIDESQVRATFNKGVLTVDLPRSAEARDRVKRIPINAGGSTH